MAEVATFRVHDTRTDLVHGSRWPNPAHMMAATFCGLETGLTAHFLGCAEHVKITCLDCIARDRW